MTKKELAAKGQAIKAANTYQELAEAVRVSDGAASWTTENACDIQDTLVMNRSLGQMVEEFKALDSQDQHIIEALITHHLNTNTIGGFYKALFEDGKAIQVESDNEKLRAELAEAKELTKQREKDLDYYCSELEKAHHEHDAALFGIAMLLEEFIKSTNSLPSKETIRALHEGGTKGETINNLFVKL